MKKRTNLANFFVSFLCIVSFFFLPLFTHAQDTTGGGANTGITYECPTTTDVNGVQVSGNCTFADLLNAVKKVVDFGTKFALMFSVIVIAYAGFKYLTSGGNAGERTKANGMLLSVAKGIAFVLAAWLIVNLITTSLLSSTVLQSVPIHN